MKSGFLEVRSEENLARKSDKDIPLIYGEKTMKTILPALYLLVGFMTVANAGEDANVCNPVSAQIEVGEAQGIKFASPAGETQVKEVLDAINVVLEAQYGSETAKDVVDGIAKDKPNTIQLGTKDNTVYILWSKGECLTGISAGPADALFSAMATVEQKRSP